MDDKPLLLLLLLLFFELSELFLPIGLNRDDNSANAIYIYIEMYYIYEMEYVQLDLAFVLVLYHWMMVI